ncbi:hypothetical protein CDAR_61621 [Caerostris darwini]|uniref:Uncharacterized protein n=1 Tax=Caerostris darwini TaxID=1538125 RepID=A0AAV4R185_9ARAC|nr:hypothetical protein CDAR_61621 [Caerostris darwini]
MILETTPEYLCKRTAPIMVRRVNLGPNFLKETYDSVNGDLKVSPSGDHFKIFHGDSNHHCFISVLSVSGLLHQPKPPGESSGRTCVFPPSIFTLISSDHIRFISSFLCKSFSILNGKIIGLAKYKPLRTELTVFSFSTSVRSGRKRRLKIVSALFFPSCLVGLGAAPSSEAPRRVEWTDVCFPSEHLPFDLLRSHQLHLVISLHQFQHFEWRGPAEKETQELFLPYSFPICLVGLGPLHQPKPRGESSGRTRVFPPSIFPLIFSDHIRFISSFLCSSFGISNDELKDIYHSDLQRDSVTSELSETENVFKGCMSSARFNIEIFQKISKKVGIMSKINKQCFHCKC